MAQRRHDRNTKKSCRYKPRNRSRSWCFTWNNHTTEDFGTLAQPNFVEKNKVSKLIFQEEIGKNNTKHIQGFIQFKNAIEFDSLKKILPKCHLEKCRNVAASIKYCSKTDTALGTPYTYGIPKPKATLPELTQEDILSDMKNQIKNDIDESYKKGICYNCELETDVCKCDFDAFP